jgi:hypothetical protein
MSDFSNDPSNGFQRRRFLGGLAAAGSAFTLPAAVFGQEGSQAAQPAAPLKGHFHPKGKAPSKFTLEILKAARRPSLSPTPATSRNSKKGSSPRWRS